MYDYQTPDGFGDTFFQYVFDAADEGLSNGSTYSLKGVLVQNGAFLMRYWSGITTLAEKLRIYDQYRRGFSDAPILVGAGLSNFYGQMVVSPEVYYPDNGKIQFDLLNVQQTLAGATKASQLVFTGVRRREGRVSDPGPSNYTYYEKKFSIPGSFTLTGTAGAAPQTFYFQVNDYDFELRRIVLKLNTAALANSPFKVFLYDQNKVTTSNKPVLSNQLMYTNWQAPTSPAKPLANVGELAFFPSPPLLYRVNSVIQLDVSSLLTAAPATFNLDFEGVRRIPCR